jgi:hypothetical protein
MTDTCQHCGVKGFCSCPTDEELDSMSQHQVPPINTQQNTFYGAVSMIDWHPDADGDVYQVFQGWITVHEAKRYLGFSTGASEANWFVTVEDDPIEYHTRYIFPGCKVAHLMECSPDVKVQDLRKVKLVGRPA